jgi:hypothetical protein
MAADPRTARERQIRARLCQFVRADLRTFLERLCALVPGAQRLKLAYHGVLARVEVTMVDSANAQGSSHRVRPTAADCRNNPSTTTRCADAASCQSLTS